MGSIWYSQMTSNFPFSVPSISSAMLSLADRRVLLELSVIVADKFPTREKEEIVLAPIVVAPLITWRDHVVAAEGNDLQWTVTATTLHLFLHLNSAKSVRDADGA